MRGSDLWFYDSSPDPPYVRNPKPQPTPLLFRPPLQPHLIASFHSTSSSTICLPVTICLLYTICLIVTICFLASLHPPTSPCNGRTTCSYFCSEICGHAWNDTKIYHHLDCGICGHSHADIPSLLQGPSDH